MLRMVDFRFPIPFGADRNNVCITNERASTISYRGESENEVKT